jgi:hypothetical protein
MSIMPYPRGMPFILLKLDGIGVLIGRTRVAEKRGEETELRSLDRGAIDLPEGVLGGG